MVKIKAILLFLKTKWINFYKAVKQPAGYFIKFIHFISAIATIWAAIYAIYTFSPQLALISKQLTELNSVPKIRLGFAVDSKLDQEIDLKSPLKITVSSVNDGNRAASYWRAGVMFCKGISVRSIEGFIREEDNMLVIESQKPVPPNLKNQLKLFSYSLDKVGAFQIILPISSNSDLDIPIPIAIIAVSGDYPNSVHQLITFYPKTLKFDKINLLQDNGWMVGDYYEKLSGCFDVKKEKGV